MDQLKGKWNNISRDLKYFNAIHKKFDPWDSKKGGAEIMANAHQEFKLLYKRSFNNENAWRVLKDCPMFYFSEGMSRNKRSMFKEQDYDPINLDDDISDPYLNPNPI